MLTDHVVFVRNPVPCFDGVRQTRGARIGFYVEVNRRRAVGLKDQPNGSFGRVQNETGVETRANVIGINKVGKLRADYRTTESGERCGRTTTRWMNVDVVKRHRRAGKFRSATGPRKQAKTGGRRCAAAPPHKYRFVGK